MRTFTGKMKNIIIVFCVLGALFHIYTAFFGVFEPRLQRPIHLGILMPLCFLLYPARKKDIDSDPNYLDYLFSAVSFYVFCVYILINKSRLDNRWMFVDALTTMDLVCGVVAIVLMLEATRRAVAPAMSVLACIALAYFRFGHFLPGMFGHSFIDLSRVVELCYLGVDLEGMFGLLTAVSASFVALYVILGSFVSRTSIGNYFNDLATALVGRSTGGAAKVAVVSSGLFGMISGVGASNVYTTGTFTIPLMKKIGYEPEFAGAVEATASTGGQYMPPIMGAAAFIMAELVGVPYVSVCIAAVTSAVIFYFALLVMVHRKSLQLRISKSNFSTMTNLELLKSSWRIAPIITLITAFAVGYTPLIAGIIGISTTIILGTLKKELNLRRIIDALNEATQNTVMVGLACACAGLIVATITYTGLGLAFTGLILNIADKSIFLCLFFIMLCCIILGMGLPTTAAYVMAATLGVPALQSLGLNLLASHLFVLYSAIFSELTPPVAICAYVGAQIAKADPTKTGIWSFKLGAGALFLPYAFVTNPALILKGSFLQIIISVISALIGIYIITYSIIPFYEDRKFLNVIASKGIVWKSCLRIILLLLGICVLFIPQIIMTFNGQLWQGI